MTTMTIPKQNRVAGKREFCAMLVAAVCVAGCGSRERASQMTSYSSQGAKSETPALFTIPPEQMSHVQVVTVGPTKLTRTLRLTGTVAYNAFKTTPVISQVGGPVSRILIVPGQHVTEGERMLEVEQPRLFAVARCIFESGGFLPAGGQELCAREGSVRTPRHCRT